MIRHLWSVLLWCQCVALLAVVSRLIRSAVNRQSCARGQLAPSAGAVSVIVPVLNEQARLAPCLEGLIRSGEEVAEILVVDGGSTDRTAQLVQAYTARDGRVRLISAAPIPPGWNGKAWGLEIGWRSRSSASVWVLTMDADVRPSSDLIRMLLETARRANLRALSIAPLQSLGGDWLSWLLHPSMLTTLVYRFGVPGSLASRPSDVWANGQVMLLHHQVLDHLGGFAVVAEANAEDVALARRVVQSGQLFGFFEADGAVTVKMYRDGREVWNGWPRSLALADGQSQARTVWQLLSLLFAQALPIPLSLLGLARRDLPRRLVGINLLLLAVRVGVLVGTRRAYPRRRWWYWLSPLVDLPVILRIWRCAWQRRYLWRGRTLMVGGR